MNRVILLPEEKIDSDLFILKRKDILEHIKSHLNAKVGDSLKVSCLNEGIGQALVKNISKDEILFQVKDLEQPLSLDIHLVCGVSRPPTIKKILEHGTSLGINKFSFFKADLSEKSFLTSKVFEKENIDKYLLLGMSQEASAWKMPVVETYQYLNQVKFQDKETKLLMSLTKDATLLNKPILKTDSLCLAIGPERGWTQSEEEYLCTQGFSPTKISEHVLRVEIALFAVMGQIHHNYLTNLKG